MSSPTLTDEQLAELPAQKVYEEICPECPFKEDICEFKREFRIGEEISGVRIVCLGMRAWVRKSNRGGREVTNMTDLRPMWEKICRELGINPQLVHVRFLSSHEAKNDYMLTGWGGVIYEDQGEPPEVIVVFPYTKGKNGWHLNWVELKDTCYHELVHLILRGEIEEEDVEKMGVVLNRRQDGWRYWRSYLRGRAMALGLEPVPLEQMRLPL